MLRLSSLEMMNSSVVVQEYAISVATAEKQFASLLLRQLFFMIERCQPSYVEHSFREVNNRVDLARLLGVCTVKDARLFTEGEIEQLAEVISPFCGLERKGEEIRAILKEAMTNHRIPHQL